MRCGRRVRAHNALRDTLITILRAALLTPTAEPKLNLHTSDRGDISLHMFGQLWIIDVAITHPFIDGNRLHALNKPGGAATAYEAVKEKKYAGKMPRNSALVPFILDTFGALSESAIKALQQFIPHYARRLGISSSVASRVVYGRLTTSVIKSMAAIATQG